MKIVMMFRRKINPATPSTNRTALRIRYQEIGTPVMLLIHLLQREHNGSDDSDQNQYGGNLKGQQIARKQRLTDILRRPAGESAEVNRRRMREQAQHRETE